jgi:hypothetical protein
LLLFMRVRLELIGIFSTCFECSFVIFSTRFECSFVIFSTRFECSFRYDKKNFKLNFWEAFREKLKFADPILYKKISDLKKINFQ